jgi:hypothetical protein
MTHALELGSSASRPGRRTRNARLDVVAAVLIATVGLGLGLVAWWWLTRLQEERACPLGFYCDFLSGIGYGILLTGVFALVLAAGIGAHRRPARLIGLVVCSLAGGKLLVEVLRELGETRDPTTTEAEMPHLALEVGIVALAFALCTAAVLLLFSVIADRTAPRSGGGGR